jgi:hypothetical protein
MENAIARKPAALPLGLPVTRAPSFGSDEGAGNHPDGQPLAYGLTATA